MHQKPSKNLESVHEKNVNFFLEEHHEPLWKMAILLFFGLAIPIILFILNYNPKIILDILSW